MTVAKEKDITVVFQVEYTLVHVWIDGEYGKITASHQDFG